MSKIYVILGKSCTGKDTLLKSLIEDKSLKLTKIIPYTTRPRRNDEIEGVDYNFVDTKELYKLDSENSVLEIRGYATDEGVWRYGTPVVDLKQGKDYIMIGTLQSYVASKKHYGNLNVIPIYLECSDSIRLLRAIERESQQANPNFREVCRRYIADETDYDELAVSGLIPQKYRYQSSDESLFSRVAEAISESKN